MIDVKIKNESGNALPVYETEGSAGMDIRAYIEEPIVLKPFERAAIPTGLYMEIPVGYLCELRPRSGLSLKEGVTIANEWLCKKLFSVINTLSVWEKIKNWFKKHFTNKFVEDDVFIVNFPPTIDSDYRGEVKVPLVNLSNRDIVIENGERICQAVFVPYENVGYTPFNVVESTELTETERGEGGFGHTGKK